MKTIIINLAGAARVLCKLSFQLNYGLEVLRKKRTERTKKNKMVLFREPCMDVRKGYIEEVVKTCAGSHISFC